MRRATCCEPAFLHALRSSDRRSSRLFRPYTRTRRSECAAGDATIATGKCIRAATASVLGRPARAIGCRHAIAFTGPLGCRHTITFTAGTFFSISCRSGRPARSHFGAAAVAGPARVSATRSGSINAWNASATTSSSVGWPADARCPLRGTPGATGCLPRTIRAACATASGTWGGPSRASGRIGSA